MMGSNENRRSWVEVDQETGKPTVVFKLKARGIKELVEVEMSPANTATIFDVPETTVRRFMEKDETKIMADYRASRANLRNEDYIEITIDGLTADFPLYELARIWDVSESKALKILNEDETALKEWHAQTTAEQRIAMHAAFMKRMEELGTHE